MANPTWTDGGDNWTTATDWSTGSVPGSADAVTVATGDPQITTAVPTIASLTDSSEVDVDTGGSLTVTGTLTNSRNFYVDTGYANGGSTVTVNGAMTNSGTLQLGAGGSTSGAVTMTVGSITNFIGTTTGTINLYGSSTTPVVLNVNSAAGFGAAGSESGNVTLSGDAQIQFASGTSSITKVLGYLDLNGASASIQDTGGAVNSALTGLTSVSGTFEIENGVKVATTGNLANTGALDVDTGYADGGSTLNIGQKITNTGTISVGTGGSSSGASTLSAGSLSNESGTSVGTINVSGNTTYLASLNVGAIAGFGVSGSLIGNVNLYDDGQIQFTSNTINTITSGSELTLNGAGTSVLDAGGAQNSALTGLTSLSGTLNMYNGATVGTNVALTVAVSANLDVDNNYAGGGSSLAIGGNLANGGTINIGNGNPQSAPTTVQVNGSLTNVIGSTDGTINIAGGPINQQTGTANEALLSIGAPAGFGTTANTLVGNVNLYDDGQIDFSSGSIMTIASGSELTLNGAQASIDNDGSDTNSALQGLTTVTGNLTLEGGASVNVTGSSLTNQGNIDVDPNYAGGGSTLNVFGLFTNDGTLQVGTGGNNSAETEVDLGGLTNFVGSTNGTIDVYGSATSSTTGAANEALLNISGPAGFGTTGSLIGNVNLFDDGEIQFASGQINTIVAGSELTLDGATAAIANDGSDTNSALTGLTTMAGTLTIRNGASLATGTATSSTNTLTVGNTLTDSGTINVPSVQIAAGGTFEVATGGNVSAPITFAGTKSGTALFALDGAPSSGSTYGNALVGFGDNDILDLKGLTFAPGATATYSGGTLTVTSNGVSENFTLTTPGATTFYARADGGTGTGISDMVCFAAGTRIRAVRGGGVCDVAIETLGIGDLVVTASGARRPVRWLGHRTVVCAGHPNREAVMPVRIAANAFGQNRPARDLYVSPAHALCVDVIDEVLIPASSLLNGSTVAQVEVDQITYWHVELDGHDILLADNMPAESYLDVGNRTFFAEAGVVTLGALPDAEIEPGSTAGFCRPFHADGALVEVVRSQMRARASSLGWTLAEASSDDLHLVVDGVRLEPTMRNASACFAVPASAKDVWLVSGTSRPCDIGGGEDRRALGICLAGLAIDKGRGTRGRRTIDLGDPMLRVGFHELEGDAWRWTSGRARLPADLWKRRRGTFTLRVDLAGASLSRWTAPAASRETPAERRAA